MDNIFISCSSRKESNKGILPAEKLYKSDIFKWSLYIAKHIYKLPENHIFILSAKYGILKLNTPIEPYDTYLGDLSKEEYNNLKSIVKSQIENIPVLKNTEKNLVIAGKLYIGLLQEYIPVVSWFNEQKLKPGLGNLKLSLKGIVESHRGEKLF